jgi:protein TonB
MKREDISRLKKNRGIYLKVGLILSLGFAFMAFNYTSYTFEPLAMKVVALEAEDEIEVVRTVHEQARQLPPPAIRPSEEILPDDSPVFSEQPIPIKIDENIISVPEPAPFEYNTAPPVPAPPMPAHRVEDPTVPPIFKIVEEMPIFGNCTAQGMDKQARRKCSDQALMEYVYSQIRYPALARENGIEGTVVVQFVVELDGSASNVKIMRDIGGGCGNEAVRAVEAMPRWTVPGMQRGRPVRVQFNLPVKFMLQ